MFVITITNCRFSSKEESFSCLVPPTSGSTVILSSGFSRFVVVCCCWSPTSSVDDFGQRVNQNTYDFNSAKMNTSGKYAGSGVWISVTVVSSPRPPPSPSPKKICIHMGVTAPVRVLDLVSSYPSGPKLSPARSRHHEVDEEKTKQKQNKKAPHVRACLSITLASQPRSAL